jgi:hypothetical protein
MIGHPLVQVDGNDVDGRVPIDFYAAAEMQIVCYVASGLLAEKRDDAGLGDIGGMGRGQLDLIISCKAVYDLHQHIRVEKSHFRASETVIPDAIFHKRELAGSPCQPDAVLGRDGQAGQDKNKKMY